MLCPACPRALQERLPQISLPWQRSPRKPELASGRCDAEFDVPSACPTVLQERSQYHRASGFSNCGQKPNRYHSRTSKQNKTRWTEIPTVWYTQSPYQFWRLGGVCLQNKRWHTSDELHVWILVAFPQQSKLYHECFWMFLVVHIKSTSIRTPQRHKFCQDVLDDVSYMIARVPTPNPSPCQASSWAPRFKPGRSQMETSTPAVLRVRSPVAMEPFELATGLSVKGDINRYQRSEQVRAHSR